MIPVARPLALFGVFLGLALFVGTDAPAASGVGSGAADFLDLPVGARSGALGGATGSLPGDLASLFRNPALLSSGSGSRLHLGHQTWFQGIEHESGILAFTLPEGAGRAALHLRYLHLDPLPVYDAALNEVGSVDVYDVAVGFSWARRFARRVDLGFNLHQARQHLGDVEGSGWVGDLGVGVLASGFYWSAAIRSLGDGISFDDAPDPVEINRELSFGAARYYPGLGAIVSMEYRRPELWGSSLHSGVEYMLSHNLVLRGGYTQSFAEDADANSLMSFGAGIKLAQLGFDYSYRSYEYLGEVHAVSIRLPGLAKQLSPYSLFRPNHR
jgi:hypothetical protein